MILDLIQEVREVSVLALLLEWAVQMLTHMIVLVIDLLPSHVVIGVKGQTLHIGCIHLACAVGVLKIVIVAHLTEVASVTIFTFTNLVALVVAAEAIALHSVGFILRYTNGVSALYCFSEESILTLMASVTCVWRWADTSTILLLLSLGEWVTLFSFMLEDRITMIKILEAILLIIHCHLEVDVVLTIRRVLAF